MPAIQRGSAYRLAAKRWGLRYRDREGVRRYIAPFPSKSAALAHYRDVIEPQLRGEPARRPDLTLSDFISLYLDRHAANVRPRTVATLRERLKHAEAAFGNVSLRDLQHMESEIAAWRSRQPERVRYGRMGALRQALGAAVRWRYMDSNPAALAGPNRQPSPRTVRAFTADELDAIAADVPPTYAALPVFAAATGLRPEEWAGLERRDVDRRMRTLRVRKTVSSGKLVDLGKTERSRRQVPLSLRALEALDSIPPRLDTALIFPAPEGGLLNLDNFRRRVWTPAVEASGIRTPARLYDLRSTFASDALSVGVTVFELARVMGTSVPMIERHYGTLLDGASASIAVRLDSLDAGRDNAKSAGPTT